MTKASKVKFAVSAGGMRSQLRRCHRRLGDLALNAARRHAEMESLLLLRDEVALAELRTANPKARRR